MMGVSAEDGGGGGGGGAGGGWGGREMACGGAAERDLNNLRGESVSLFFIVIV